MFAHAPGHENDSKAKTPVHQGRSAYDTLAGFNRAQKQGYDLRVKRFANNELRVSYGQSRPPAKRGGSEAGAERCFAEAERLLVYNAKVQHRGDLVLPPVPRARGMVPTRYRMHSVREAVWILEAKYAKEAHFVTFTLPGRTPEAIATFARESTGIMNALMQRYRHFLQHDAAKILNINNAEQLGSLQNDSCWVAEYHKDGTLHYHLVIGMENSLVVRVLRKSFKRWWRNVLLHYSEKTQVDLFGRVGGGSWKAHKNKPRVEFEKVKKSVSRYMSKYISKGAHSSYEENWAPPACWSYVSDSLWDRVLEQRHFNAVKFLTKDSAVDAAEQLKTFAEKMGGKVLEMKNPFNGEKCGFVAFFEDHCKDIVYSMWNQDVARWGASPEAVRSRDGPEGLWCGCEFEYLRGVDLIFEGKPIAEDWLSSADLCAPFSATEKGGGMR